MSVKKYIAGLAVAFGLGVGAGYCLSNGVEKTWDDTKYFAYKAQRAAIAAGDVMNDVKPGPLKKVDEVIINVGHGMTMEEAEKKHEEMKSDLDFKISQHEKDEK
jgi:hypothetical protein